MATQKAATQQVTQAAEPAAPEPGPLLAEGLVPAASSGDGAVQDLVALREIYDRNGDTGGVTAVDEALAGFGAGV